MCSRCLKALAVSAVFAVTAAAAGAADRELRVCADPDNLPYSHEDGSGFENRIAAIVAQELGAKLVYTWYPQRRAFLRRTLNAGACDAVIGVPSGLELALTTKPYYRSTYVFVFRTDAPVPFRSFDDEHLRRAKVGVQLIGDDLAATPAGHALALRGIVKNVSGYPVYGERPQPERMIEAVARREIDVALIWGPQAAYYARRQPVALAIAPAPALPELSMLPMQFSMSMGVRRSDAMLKVELERVIDRRRADLQAVLREYGVPLADRSVAAEAVRELP